MIYFVIFYYIPLLISAYFSIMVFADSALRKKLMSPYASFFITLIFTFVPVINLVIVALCFAEFFIKRSGKKWEN